MRYNSESGRSMVEMLGVLAVMGVLTVTTFVGFSYMKDKYTANEIVRDAHMTYVTYESDKSQGDDWKPIDFRPKIDLPFFHRHDRHGYFLIKTEQVPQKVCMHLLNANTYADVILLNEAQQRMTSCPGETNTVLFMFAKGEGALTPCQEDADCPKGGFCRVDTGFCQVCQEGYHISWEKNGCLKDCKDEETICMMDEFGWCCPDNLICGEGLGQCIESDGLCSYEVIRNFLPYGSNCSYQVMSNSLPIQSNCSYQVMSNSLPIQSNCSYQVMSNSLPIQSNCSYQVMSNSLPIKSNCSYRIPNFVADASVQAEKIKGCPSGEYCSMGYTEDSCRNTVPADHTGVVHGFCHKWTSNNTSCQVIDEKGPAVKPIKGCPSGEYCSMGYTEETCRNTVPAEHLGVVHGFCHKWTSNNTSCQVVDEQGPVVKQIKGCSSGEYCSMGYKEETCQNTVPAEHLGVVHGFCHKWTSNNTSCQVVDEKGPAVKLIKGCPDGEYCSMGYKEETCQTAVPAEHLGVVHGFCHKWTSNNTSCQVVDEQGPVVKQIKGCPDGEYCSMGYVDESCSTSVSAEHTGIVHGFCHKWTSNNTSCQVVDEKGRSVIPKHKCPETKYCSLHWSDTECTSLNAEAKGMIYGTCQEFTENNGFCPYP